MTVIIRVKVDQSISQNVYLVLYSWIRLPRRNSGETISFFSVPNFFIPCAYFSQAFFDFCSKANGKAIEDNAWLREKCFNELGLSKSKNSIYYWALNLMWFT